jgi:hypothetical protein
MRTPNSMAPRDRPKSVETPAAAAAADRAESVDIEGTLGARRIQRTLWQSSREREKSTVEDRMGWPASAVEDNEKTTSSNRDRQVPSINILPSRSPGASPCRARGVERVVRYGSGCSQAGRTTLNRRSGFRIQRFCNHGARHSACAPTTRNLERGSLHFSSQSTPWLQQYVSA